MQALQKMRTAFSTFARVLENKGKLSEAFREIRHPLTEMPTLPTVSRTGDENGEAIYGNGGPGLRRAKCLTGEAEVRMTYAERARTKKKDRIETDIARKRVLAMRMLEDIKSGRQQMSAGIIQDSAPATVVG